MGRIRVGVLTISDRASAGEYQDASGPLLQRMVTGLLGGEVELAVTIPDELDAIRDKLLEWVGSDRMDLILTTGGTGFAPRDVTPEATRQVIERETPGLAEAMRLASLEVTPFAMLSRGVAGIRGRVLIVNLPGSPKAARENLNAILPALSHGLELLAGGGTDAGHQYRPNKDRI
ncbi:MAG: molybdopterin adenylyltransferase [Ardenticatenales bacterium]|nr:molybdopterin adenylyltransferase [Ardenticatenales bacterium]